MDINTISNIITALFEFGSVIAAVICALVITVNIIVEVLKGLFPKLPTNFLVVIVSEVGTVLTLYIVSAALHITVMWYYAVGAVVIGLFVAYAAMFGFDKFSDAWTRLKDLWAKK